MAFMTTSKKEILLFPPAIDDLVRKDAPVRVYDAFVDALDFNALGISLAPSPHGGQDEYYPKDMLKLWLFGYSYGIRSSRKIERACYDNVSFIWLMGGLKPDFRTIARFRSDHKEAIKKVLKQCVHMCQKLDLIEGNIFFTDGSKFRADASINNTRTQQGCEQTLRKIEEQINKIIDESEQIDAQEQDEKSLVKLKEQIHDRAKLINKIQDTLNALKAQNKDSLNSTDPESVKAKSRQGTHAVYNVQSTVDGKHGLMIQAEAVSQSNDFNQLSSQVKQASETVGKEPRHICADAGYSDVDDAKKINPSINIIVPSQRQAQEEKGLCPIKEFDKSKFVYDELTDEYVCPEGKHLTFHSIPEPDKRCYEAQASECRACSHFGDPADGGCTKSIRGRRIIRLADEKLKEQLEANYKLPENQKIYKLRKQEVEHPFGHLKRNLGAGQFMLRGKAKVDAEVSLLATCFNMARMMTIFSVPGLLAKLIGN